MAQDKLVVSIADPAVGVHMNYVNMNLERDDIEDKTFEVIVGVWGWDPNTTERYADKLDIFLIDPDLWKAVGHSIKWPDVSDKSKAVQDAVTLCKIKVYKAMRMHWTHAHAMMYSRRSEDHREDILAITGQ